MLPYNCIKTIKHADLNNRIMVIAMKTEDITITNVTNNNNDVFSSTEYARSRKAYVFQCTVEYFVSLLVADAFLAKLLTNVGVSDSMIGIISSFISLAFLFQILSIPLVQKFSNTKKTVIFFDTLSQLFFMMIYIVPFLPIAGRVKITIIIISILIAYISKYLIISLFFTWANSYVNPMKRGEFSAVKEMISLISGIVFTLAIGYIIDRYDEIGNIKGGFLFIAVAMFVLNICNFVSLNMIKNDTKDNAKEKPKYTMHEIAQHTIFDRQFVNIVIMSVGWQITMYLTTGFMGVFKTKDLLLSVGTVQVINMAASLLRFVLSKPIGIYSDKKSYAKGLELAYIIAAVGFAINIFTSNKTWWLVIIFTVLYNVSLAGTNQNSQNIIYSYIEKPFIVHALAIKNSISGIAGFAASLFAGRLLSYIQNNGNMFLGIHIYAQQVMSALSLIFVIATILFTHFVVCKQLAKKA